MANSIQSRDYSPSALVGATCQVRANATRPPQVATNSVRNPSLRRGPRSQSGVQSGGCGSPDLQPDFFGGSFLAEFGVAVSGIALEAASGGASAYSSRLSPTPN